MKRKLSILSLVFLAFSLSSVIAQNNNMMTLRKIHNETINIAERTAHKAHDPFVLFPKSPQLYTPQKAKDRYDWWEPDTIYSANFEQALERNIFCYNQQGFVIIELEQWWQNNTWVNYGQYAYTYDSNNNMLTETGLLWQNDTWKNIGRYTFSYDSNNNMLSRISQEWQNGTWINGGKRTYTYDSNNNMLISLYQYWYDTWINDAQYTYTYNSNNNLLTFLRQWWHNWNDTWENTGKDTFTYDSNNNRLTELNQGWENNNWENDRHVTYTYDSNNNLLIGLYQSWINDTWENIGRYSYTYDSNNNLLAVLVESPNFNSWRNSKKSTYTYDSNNNLLTSLDEKWEGIGNGYWINTIQRFWIYDENNNCTLAEKYAWIDGNWHPGWGLIMPLYYNNMQSSYEPVCYYECHKFTASYKKYDKPEKIEDLKLSRVFIYPNPTTGKLTIDSGELRIVDVVVHDIFGKIKRIENLKMENTIDISHFSAGVYFVKISTEAGEVTRRVLKE